MDAKKKFKLKKEIAGTLVLALLLMPSAQMIQVKANPLPYYMISMPEEYIYANITVDEVGYAKVRGDYPFQNRGYSNISMLYPLPLNTSNVSLEINQNSTTWTYSDKTYRSMFGDLPMISWAVYPASHRFVVEVEYEHSLPLIDQFYNYFYPMGTWKYLKDIYTDGMMAHFSINIVMKNLSDKETLNIKAFEIFEMEDCEEFELRSLEGMGLSISRENTTTFKVSTAIGYSTMPIMSDFLLTFKKAPLSTINVPDDHHTISEALKAANLGDTIFVKSGIYYENIYVYKSLHLVGSPNAVIDGNETGLAVGIVADDVEFRNFTVQRGWGGIWILGGRCNVTGNKVINNKYGISLSSHCESSILRNNTISGNIYNMGFQDLSIPSNLDIDSSNTINGKPVYYWVNQHNKQVPEDAGYIAVVNSTNITVKHLSLTNNFGVLFVNTSNSIIQDVELMDSFDGIILKFANNNNITNNKIYSVQLQKSFDDYSHGIWLSNSRNNVITSNNITDKKYGLEVDSSQSNVVVGNTISNCIYGLSTISSSNLIYLNNFVNNTQHVLSYGSSNRWDYNGEGNYWDNYTGIDADADGIGDMVYTINTNNQDNYPLMKPFSPEEIRLRLLSYKLEETISELIRKINEQELTNSDLTTQLRNALRGIEELKLIDSNQTEKINDLMAELSAIQNFLNFVGEMLLLVTIAAVSILANIVNVKVRKKTKPE